MQNFEAILKKYDYDIPKELIAQKPASPRDSSKLLIYLKKGGEVFYDRFINIADYLPKNAVLVFNETKVLPARLILKKETGGKVKILYVAKKGDCIQAMADRKLAIGAKLWLDKKYFFTVKGSEGKYYSLTPSFKISSIFSILEKYGLTPVPPYIKNSPLSEKGLKTKYQAVFAKHRGSVAAPTASLHFTKRLLKKIKNAGIDIRFITLHVNLGTFAPLAEENIKASRLHKEHYEIDKKTAEFLNKAKKNGRPIIAVGTTVIRTLESSAASGVSIAGHRGNHCSKGGFIGGTKGPRAIGFLLMKEFQVVSEIFFQPQRPIVVIFQGSKTDKIPAIKSLVEKRIIDKAIITGGIFNLFMNGDKEARAIQEIASKNNIPLIFPDKVVAAQIPPNMSRENFIKQIKANTI